MDLAQIIDTFNITSEQIEKYSINNETFGEDGLEYLNSIIEESPAITPSLIIGCIITYNVKGKMNAFVEAINDFNPNGDAAEDGCYLFIGGGTLAVLSSLYATERFIKFSYEYIVAYSDLEKQCCSFEEDVLKQISKTKQELKNIERPEMLNELIDLICKFLDTLWLGVKRLPPEKYYSLFGELVDRDVITSPNSNKIDSHIKTLDEQLEKCNTCDKKPECSLYEAFKSLQELQDLKTP